MVPQGQYLNLCSYTFAQHISLHKNKLLAPQGNELLHHSWKTPSTQPLWRLHTLAKLNALLPYLNTGPCKHQSASEMAFNYSVRIYTLLYIKAGSQYHAKQCVALHRLRVDACRNATRRQDRLITMQCDRAAGAGPSTRTGTVYRTRTQIMRHTPLSLPLRGVARVISHSHSLLWAMVDHYLTLPHVHVTCPGKLQGRHVRCWNWPTWRGKSFAAQTLHIIYSVPINFLQLTTGVSSSILSEAVSFLNGAHLNPRGQLSKLFRRYYQTRSASSSPNAGVSSVEASPPLTSLVLSELGVNELNQKQLSQALANCWTSLDSHSINSGTITVCDILKLCRGTLCMPDVLSNVQKCLGCSL